SGKHQSLIKATEARFSVEQGADEVDMVIDVANAVAGDENAMLSEIMAVREALPAPAVLKVILVCALITVYQLCDSVITAYIGGDRLIESHALEVHGRARGHTSARGAEGDPGVRAAVRGAVARCSALGRPRRRGFREDFHRLPSRGRRQCRGCADHGR